MILAGDVGGTKSRLALYAPGASPRDPVRERRLESREFPSLEALALEFLGPDRDRVTAAALGIAGPIIDNRSDEPNLPWIPDGRALSQRLGGPRVRLLNDLEATGFGLTVLEERDFRSLQRGAPTPGNRALIAAGTGLGEGILVWDGTTHHPSPSEGGHADFGPRDAIEDEMAAWFRRKYGRVSYEHILSGPGLADLYRFLTETGRGSEPPEVARRFASEAEPASVVTATGLDGSCERAALALERWVWIYGAEAGNLALKALAVNGVFLAGGIAPRVVSVFERSGFLAAFRDKGRLAPLLDRIPVALVLDDRVALWGAAAYALERVGRDVAPRVS